MWAKMRPAARRCLFVNFSASAIGFWQWGQIVFMRVDFVRSKVGQTTAGRKPGGRVFQRSDAVLTV